MPRMLRLTKGAYWDVCLGCASPVTAGHLDIVDEGHLLGCMPRMPARRLLAASVA